MGAVGLKVLICVSSSKGPPYTSQISGCDSAKHEVYTGAGLETGSAARQRQGEGETIHYSRQAGAERLIATGRATLAGFSLVAIWLDPSEPSNQAEVTYAILSGYVVYAVVLAAAVVRGHVPSGLLAILSHTFDLAIFSVIMFFSLGPSSPFFVFFVFSLVCATLRWQWKGAIWTSVAALTTVVGMSFYPTYLLHNPNFEMNRFIMRVVYLGVLGTLLGYAGVYEQARRRELSALAAWPHTLPDDLAGVARQSLEHAAHILNAPRVLLVWEGEEPWVYVSSWTGADFCFSREAPGTFGSLVAEPLAGKTFFCTDTKTAAPAVVYSSPQGLRKWHGVPLPASVQNRFGAKAVLALRIDENNFQGYLFALDKMRMTSDDLVLGGITAQGVISRFNHYYMLQQLRDTATADERVRLSRDLHDGLLQSLTGAALQLESAQRLVEADPGSARERILEIERLIEAEQRDLRIHIEHMRPSYPRQSNVIETLSDRVKELARQIERQWGIRVEMDLEAGVHLLSTALARHVYFILHESLINAARHARASSVQVKVSIVAGRLRIIVADDGCGFPFKGCHDHAALNDMNAGPVTLKERTALLGGKLRIDSSEAGSRLEIMLPLAEKGD